MHRKRLLVEVRSLFDEALFVDSQQVLSGRVVVFFPVPAFVNRAIAYEPDRKLRRLFGSFYFLGHLVAGVTHLVQGKGRYPSISSDALGVAVFALNFRHDFVLAAIAAYLDGGGIFCVSRYLGVGKAFTSSDQGLSKWLLNFRGVFYGSVRCFSSVDKPKLAEEEVAKLSRRRSGYVCSVAAQCLFLLRTRPDTGGPSFGVHVLSKMRRFRKITARA